MSSAPRLTVLAFGVTSLGAGLYALLNPLSQAQALSLPPSSAPTVRANALAAIAMGLYYPLAAYQDNEAFFALSVPMRLLSTAVFWRQNWRAAAIWEGVGSGLTALSLLWSWSRRQKQKSG